MVFTIFNCDSESNRKLFRIPPDLGTAQKQETSIWNFFSIISQPCWHFSHVFMFLLGWGLPWGILSHGLFMASLWSSVLSKMKISVYAETGFFFSTLSGLVEFDGYYLESDPCLVCNNPEVPFCVSDIFNVDGPEAHRASGFLTSRDWLLRHRCSPNAWSSGVRILTCYTCYLK